ncbi:MAG: DUF1015 domain-containing protein [Deltaproteobacteria bacterium]|nr:DUF1015 domain-containing protein [Deltaproteobacteria bacterium]
MAVVQPFKGIRYNPKKIKNLSEVATPPYDVISKKEQQAFYDRHPRNIIRLDKGMDLPGDNEGENRYIRAGRYFGAWLAGDVLIKDDRPSFYLTTVNFKVNGDDFVRYGLIARVRLEPFSSRIILPHEKTFSKVKTKRLALMKACHANFSHIFSIYTDGQDGLSNLRAAASGLSPESDFIDDAGHRHRMWRIFDPKVLSGVSQAFADRQLFIADGHHRYETALNYRDWIAGQTPDFNEDHPANYVMMYLCAMEDPGLKILPTHRLLSGISAEKQQALLARAGDWFDIIEIPPGNGDESEAQKQMEGLLEEKQNEAPAIGMVLQSRPELFVLTAKPGFKDTLIAGNVPDLLCAIDVTVLTQLILIRCLGLLPDDLDNEDLFDYITTVSEAVSSVRNGDHDVAFIMNPATNEQVRAIAGAGLTMPRKSTYYYPKAITGQVMNFVGNDLSGYGR